MTNKNQSPFGLPSKIKESPPWWEFNPAWNFDPYEAMEKPAMVRNIDSKEEHKTTYFCGTRTLTKLPTKKIIAKLGSPTAENVTLDGKINMQVWMRKDGVLRCSGGDEPKAKIATFDKNVLRWFQKTFLPLQVRVEKCGSLFVAGRSSPKDPMEFRRMGYINQRLERGNYDVSVLEQFDRAKIDLRSVHPKGRLLLLDGPPGTGKTYLLRGLIGEIEASYVLVNPQNYDDLMNPEFLSALHDDYDVSSNRIVLVLEDADKLLTPRNAGASLEGLSSALNMGDGLMSELFDIRIIATTNAAVQDIDPAILRKGRLSERISIEKLDGTKATEILRRLLPDSKEELIEKTALSDVYAKARELGWVPPEDSGMQMLGKNRRNPYGLPMMPDDDDDKLAAMGINPEILDHAHAEPY